MTKQVISGGNYVDALGPAFACLRPSKDVLTHLGAIPLPPGEDIGPLFVRIFAGPGGVFKIAGQQHIGNGGWEWVGSRWNVIPPPCCGDSPVIYDLAGTLHVSDCSIGSQGWRYVAEDGSLVTGDATYGSDVGLSEWSAYGGLKIGQGHDGGGVRVWDGEVLRVLPTSSIDCRFVRVHGVGEDVTVSFLDGPDAVIVRTTLGELRNLEAVQAAPQVTVVPAPVNPVLVPDGPRPSDPEVTKMPASIPPMPTADFATSTLSDPLLRGWITGELFAANSNDDPVYWFNAIRTHPTPATQNDAGYWHERIWTGDGAGRGYTGPRPDGSGTVQDAPGSTQGVPAAPTPTFDPAPILTSLEGLKNDLLDLSSKYTTLAASVAALAAKPAPPVPTQASGRISFGDVLKNSLVTWGLK